MLAFSFPVITVYKVDTHCSMLHLSNQTFHLTLHVTFWKFSLRNFQGCCLLFNYQGSVLFRCIFATALIDYHIFRRLSTTFLNYFLLSFFKRFCHPTAYLDYHISRCLSTTFLLFSNHFQVQIFNTFTTFLHIIVYLSEPSFDSSNRISRFPIYVNTYFNFFLFIFWPE